MTTETILPHAETLDQKMEWLEQVRRNSEGDPELLLSGLRADDAKRWDIGILDARYSSVPLATSIWLTLPKPRHRRTASEADWTEHRFDPEAVFIMQMFALFGGRVGVDYSENDSGLIYHYPSLTLPGHPFVRFHRFIVDAPPYELAKGNPSNFHDWRRCSLGLTIHQRRARRIFGKQKSGAYRTREDFIRIGTTELFTPLAVGRLRGAGQYRSLLREAYRLLDWRRPLGKRSLLDDERSLIYGKALEEGKVNEGRAWW